MSKPAHQMNDDEYEIAKREACGLPPRSFNTTVIREAGSASDPVVLENTTSSTTAATAPKNALSMTDEQYRAARQRIARGELVDFLPAVAA